MPDFPGENLPKPTEKRAHGLETSDFERTVWGHVLALDTDWHEALDGNYWEHVANRLRPGDRIECHTADHRIQFNIYVFQVNARTTPVHLELGFQPLYPANLDLPLPTASGRARFQVRRQQGMANRYEILDGQTGVVAVSWLDLHSAQDRAALLELGAQTDPTKAVEPPRRARA